MVSVPLGAGVSLDGRQARVQSGQLGSLVVGPPAQFVYQRLQPPRGLGRRERSAGTVGPMQPGGWFGRPNLRCLGVHALKVRVRRRPRPRPRSPAPRAPRAAGSRRAATRRRAAELAPFDPPAHGRRRDPQVRGGLGDRQLQGQAHRLGVAARQAAQGALQRERPPVHWLLVSPLSSLHRGVSTSVGRPLRNVLRPLHSRSCHRQLGRAAGRGLLRRARRPRHHRHSGEPQAGQASTRSGARPCPAAG